MTTLDELREEMQRTDPAAVREYERLRPLFALMGDVVKRRAILGLSQAQLAARMGRKQPSIGRFESGNANPTLGFLQDVAEALGARLIVRLEPKGQSETDAEEIPASRKRVAGTRRRKASATA
jgi:ribosome-binding protein aMBF1 (putative translation factor)